MTEEESSEQELDSDESEGKDWSDLEREAAESDEERSDNDERSDDGIELGQKECGNFFVSKCRSWSHLIWRWCIFPLIVACKYVQNQTFFKRTLLEFGVECWRDIRKTPSRAYFCFLLCSRRHRRGGGGGSSKHRSPEKKSSKHHSSSRFDTRSFQT